MKSFWDETILVSELPKNDKGDVIRVQRVRKRKAWYVDVRTFYVKNGELLPGKGISIPDDLADEVGLAVVESSENGGD